MKRLPAILSPAGLRRRFRRLQWRLTFSYMVVTVGAILVVELLLLLGLLLFINSGFFARIVIQGLESDVVAEVRPFLAEDPVDREGLQAYLASVERSGSGEDGLVINLDEAGTDRLLVVDRQGIVVGGLPAGESRPDLGRPLFTSGALPASAQPALELLWAEVQGAPEKESVYRTLPANRFVALVPVTSPQEGLVGALLLLGNLPGWNLATLGPVAQLLLVSLLPLTLGAGLIGTFFGAITARGLSRRLQAVTEAAGAWSEGDFTAVIQDHSGDELGQLTRRLNVMAEQLQNLVETRQELATLEERNRLARDLHDSVKQQVFATAMQVAAARSLLPANPEAAQESLAEAERLTRQAQQELTGLIQELRPAALEGRGLAEALRHYLPEWAQRTGIEAAVRVQGARPLPLPVEQAIFRVAQEALANVARHSRAETVDVHLVWTEEVVSLTVTDDGRGFEQAERSAGMGLHSMRERMEKLGGTLLVESRRDEGTRVVAWVRLDE